MAISINIHRIDVDSFRLLKEAFPWKYQKRYHTEWVELEFDGVDVTFFLDYSPND